MTTLWITPSSGAGTVTHSSTTNDTAVDVSGVTPTSTWTLYLRVLSNSMSGTQRARIFFQDSVDNFASDIAYGPGYCIVPVTNVPEGREYSIRWRNFDDLRIGVSSAKLRTALTRITGGSVTYAAWLTY